MEKQILIEKFMKKLDFSYMYKTNNERQNIIAELYEIAGIEQLDLPVIVRQSEQLICDTCKSGLIDYPEINRRTCRCGALGYNVTD